MVAEYDGWVAHGQAREDMRVYKHETLKINGHFSIAETFKYNTSIEWLWPVAAKICNEEDRCLEWSCIEERRGKEESVRSIRLAATTFDISKLFTTVCSAIRLINEYKTKEK